MAEARPVALVTGANRGLGEAIASALAARGFRVGVLGRNLEACAAVARRIAGAGGDGAHAFACDMAEPSTIDAAIAAAHRMWGRIDALVNNAGVVAPIGAFDTVDPDGWAQVIAVNLTGPYRAIRAAMPALIEAQPGRIVNVSSGAAQRPLEGWSAYCTSKAGLAMLTRAVDLEAQDRGVLCFSIAPGVVDTGMQAEIRQSGINPVSRLPRESLSPAHEPAMAIAWLVEHGTAELAGRELDVRDPDLRRRCGLAD